MDPSFKYLGEYSGTKYYLGDVTKDTFVHFTTLQRAKSIIAAGSLLADPPGIKKFGIAGVQAVSILFGKSVPGVQWTHIKTSPESIVAIIFKTSAVPNVGQVEEVIWHGDVPISGPRLVLRRTAEGMLKGTEDDVCVLYDPNDPWIAELQKKSQPQPQAMPESNSEFMNSEDALRQMRSIMGQDDLDALAWVRANCKFCVG